MRCLACFAGRHTGYLEADPGHVLDFLLHPDFRHCFVALATDEAWIRLDAVAGQVVCEIVAPADYDLPTYYRAQGIKVIETEQGPGVVGPFVPANCVGLVRAVLGIRAPLAFTPYRLYRRLTR